MALNIADASVSANMVQLLILDLDETLIHATEHELDFAPDFKIEPYFVYKRPYLETFLAFCQQNFKVGIWTTAGSEFAKVVFENAFPKNYSVEFIWSNKRCTRAFDPNLMEHYYIKNLAKLKRRGYRLEQTIMVDDTPRKLERNYGNLVRIKAWFGEADDSELLRLRNYLINLREAEDIRTVEKRGWYMNYEP